MSFFSLWLQWFCFEINSRHLVSSQSNDFRYQVLICCTILKFRSRACYTNNLPSNLAVLLIFRCFMTYRVSSNFATLFTNVCMTTHPGICPNTAYQSPCSPVVPTRDWHLVICLYQPLPPTQTALVDFSYSGPTAWNSLPPNMKDSNITFSVFVGSGSIVVTTLKSGLWTQKVPGSNPSGVPIFYEARSTAQDLAEPSSLRTSTMNTSPVEHQDSDWVWIQ